MIPPLGRVVLFEDASNCSENRLTPQVLPTQQTEAETQPAVATWSRLLRAHATTTRRLSVDLQAQHGLTINDYEALYVLSRAEGRRMKRVELAGRLGVDGRGGPRGGA